MFTIRERVRIQDKVSIIIMLCTCKYMHYNCFYSMYKSLESHTARLESDSTESRLKLSDLNDKVAAQSEIIEQLKVKIILLLYMYCMNADIPVNLVHIQVDLDHSCRERDSLHEQIQLQRETAAASINRMQNHYLEKCAELHKRIQEQTGKLKEVRSMPLCTW